MILLREIIQKSAIREIHENLTASYLKITRQPRNPRKLLPRKNFYPRKFLPWQQCGKWKYQSAFWTPGTNNNHKNNNKLAKNNNFHITGFIQGPNRKKRRSIGLKKQNMSSKKSKNFHWNSQNTGQKAEKKDKSPKNRKNRKNRPSMNHGITNYNIKYLSDVNHSYKVSKKVKNVK